MQIELRHLRYFIAVAESLHFHRAAERLNITQPALTRAIQLLEAYIGVQLFERSTRNVALTQAGETLLDGSRQIHNLLEQTLLRTRKTAAGECGHLTIGYTDFAINDTLPGIVYAFRKACPDVSIEPSHGVTSRQLLAVSSGQLDFGFVTGPVFSAMLDTVQIAARTFVVILPDTHVLAAQPSISLAQLADKPFVLGIEQDWQHYHDHLYRLCRNNGFEPNVVQRAFNTEGIFGLIACGMGVTIQPECVRNYIRKGLAVRPIQERCGSVPIIAIWNKQALTPAKARFIAFLRSHCNRDGADSTPQVQP